MNPSYEYHKTSFMTSRSVAERMSVSDWIIIKQPRFFKKNLELQLKSIDTVLKKHILVAYGTKLPAFSEKE